LHLIFVDSSARVRRAKKPDFDFVCPKKRHDVPDPGDWYHGAVFEPCNGILRNAIGRPRRDGYVRVKPLEDTFETRILFATQLAPLAE
jgi:hypothetical protein